MIKKRSIDKIIIFDIDSQIGLNRKIKAKDIIPYPWNDIIFLIDLEHTLRLSSY